MDVIEIMLLALALVVTFATLADRLRLPYPVMFLIGGILVAFAPGLPHVNLDPATIFLIFIPPLVFSAGWRISWRDFKRQLWPITLLSTGLVFATLLVVAVVAHLT
ncbi:MAG TPA: cation:proton antiporter, partial [Ktedonobacterales bacterium]|nr:cation:proton antiporter [Ktedonobacterales bacterium]